MPASPSGDADSAGDGSVHVSTLVARGLKIGDAREETALDEAGANKPQVLVPATAVARVGKENLVFVPISPTSFLPRTVTVGRRMNDAIEITSGVQAGERLVVEGTFVLKSELLR